MYWEGIFALIILSVEVFLICHSFNLEQFHDAAGSNFSASSGKSVSIKFTQLAFSQIYLKAQFSFSSGLPLEVTSIARRNSLKSTKPFLSLSKVLNTWSQNSPALPAGKHFE